MKNFMLLTLMGLFCLPVLADHKPGHHGKGGGHKRHHESHEHGVAQITFAFQGKEGKFEFEAAAEGVLGFEHEAKTEDEKKKVAGLIENFEKNIGKFVEFDSTLGCQFTKDAVGLGQDHREMKMTKNMKKEHKMKHGHEEGHHGQCHKEECHEGEHSDFKAVFAVTCQKDILGSKVKFDFTSFSGLEKIEGKVLGDNIQKSVKIKSKAETVELK